MYDRKILPNPTDFLPFGKVPKKNNSYCVQENSINGYKILNHDQSEERYQVIGKTVTLKSHYRIRRSSDGVALGSVIQQQLTNVYEFEGTHDQSLGQIRFVEKKAIVKISENRFESKITSRGKGFDFVDQNDNMVLTIDKKFLSFRDVYHIVHIDNFPHLIAQMIAIAIDDYFHEGTRN